MAQHGHTWHDLCTLMITHVTTCECHDHTLHNSFMHMITHGTIVALTMHSTTTHGTIVALTLSHTAQHNHKWHHMGTNESPFAMSCTLSLQWLQVVPWIWSVSNALQDHVQTHKQAQKAWAHSHYHMGSPCCMTWWQKLCPAQSSEPLDGSTLDIMQTILHMFSPGCVLLNLRQIVFHVKHFKSMPAPVCQVVPSASHATHFSNRPTCIFISITPTGCWVAPRLAA